MPVAVSQKNFTGWWFEETENVFQKIERWTTCVKGYNRLLPEKETTLYWTQKLCSILKRPTNEETKLNCCGGFNYKTNANLDKNCLESYSLDHSIYFKTIGEIRNNNQNQNNNKNDCDDNNNNVNDKKDNETNEIQDCGDFLASDFDNLEDDEECNENLPQRFWESEDEEEDDEDFNNNVQNESLQKLVNIKMSKVSSSSFQPCRYTVYAK